MLMFGTEGKISAEEFKQNLQSSKCSWIFDRYQIRKRQDKYFMDDELLDEVLQGLAIEVPIDYEPSPRGIPKST